MKGLSEAQVQLRHVPRVASNPDCIQYRAHFPSIISGSTVVAMVLTLPTLGPLLLDALLATRHVLNWHDSRDPDLRASRRQLPCRYHTGTAGSPHTLRKPLRQRAWLNRTFRSDPYNRLRV